MKNWVGSDEFGSYTFIVSERLSTIDQTVKYDLTTILNGRNIETIWFHTLPSLRSYLAREYGKFTLKIKKPE
jgi:hypothetical protein